jgi:hypothetical protein
MYATLRGDMSIPHYPYKIIFSGASSSGAQEATATPYAFCRRLSFLFANSVKLNAIGPATRRDLR